MQSSASVFGGAHDFVQTLLQTTITEARSIQVANTDALATTAGRIATVEGAISTTQVRIEESTLLLGLGRPHDQGTVCPMVLALASDRGFPASASCPCFHMHACKA